MNKTIFAPITSIGGAVIGIRISGLDFKNFFKHFNIDFQKIKPKYAKVLDLYHEEDFLDKVILIYFPKDNSFTGEDVIEVSIHGSKFILNKFLNILSSLNNFRLAKQGEFTKRAYLNKKIDLLEAEGINYIIRAETFDEFNLANKFLTGKASDNYKLIKDKIIEIMSIVESLIDFSDEDLPIELENKINFLKKEITEKISKYNDKKDLNRILEGIKIGIFGKPNVGKSSLMNYLCDDDISIVSDISGTTRDVISSYKLIDGIKVKFIDTAGINRETNDKIEQIGIEKSFKFMNLCDIRIFIYDIDNLIDKDNIELNDIKELTEDDLIIINKIDKVNLDKIEDIEIKFNNKYLNKIHFISIKERLNLEKLNQSLQNILERNRQNINSAMILNERHSVLLNNALKTINSSNLDTGLEIFSENMKFLKRNLEELIGIIYNDDILDKIFRDFCIGK